jgi:hypothetical protein
MAYGTQFMSEDPGNSLTGSEGIHSIGRPWAVRPQRECPCINRATPRDKV